MNNSVFGKSMENVRNPRIHLDFEWCGYGYRRRQVIQVIKLQI